MTSPLRRLIVLLVAAVVAASLVVHAQSGTQPADKLFLDASAKEAAVRKALTASAPPVTLLKAVRTVVGDYETLVRRFPASPYCDDALWRAAQLSDEAFRVFRDPREQATARRLFTSLASQHPSSQFARGIPQAAPDTPRAGTVTDAELATAATAKPMNAVVRTTPVDFPKPASGVATITAIRRVTLGQVVRIVVEVDREVSFHDERIADPARVFVDLPSTKAAPTLKDQTIRFSAADGPVKLVRLGRHPNETTRVVLEAEGVSSYSVYPLYNPFRLVIDCLRAEFGVDDVEAPPVLVAQTPRIEAPPARPMEIVAEEPVLPVTSEPYVSDATLEARRLDTWHSHLPEVERASLDVAVLPPPAPIRPVSTLPPSTTTAAPPASATRPPPTPPDRNLAGGFSMARQLGLSVSRVVIDPGHGGHDPGAKGAGMTEADLVLDVSRRLAALLAEVPGVEAILTRNTNEYVALQERTAIANRQNADLFLSVHANASNSAQVHGVETYVLNFATTLSAAAVAARENAAAGQSMSALPDVVKTIALHNKLDESRDFATMVQREMVTKLRPANKSLRDLGVKQAPFVVLIGAAMPSVLAEISFMTNPKEAPLLKSSSYRQLIAEALFSAVRKYQLSLNAAPAFAQQSR